MINLARPIVSNNMEMGQANRTCLGKIVIENLIEIKKRRLGHLRANAFASLFQSLVELRTGQITIGENKNLANDE